MIFLMSFTKKEVYVEESPECFDFADGIANAYEATHSYASYERIHAEFEAAYWDCEFNTLFDEFQFP